MCTRQGIRKAGCRATCHATSTDPQAAQEDSFDAALLIIALPLLLQPVFPAAVPPAG